MKISQGRKVPGLRKHSEKNASASFALCPAPSLCVVRVGCIGIEVSVERKENIKMQQEKEDGFE